jgi:aminoglycoside phosphotransferase (APT) family kinase protein
LWRSSSTSWGTVQGVDFATSGIPTERAYVDAYLKRVGRGPVDDWNFYVAFSVFRLASIGQGVYRRILNGVAPSDRKAVNGAPELSRRALAILHGKL